VVVGEGAVVAGNAVVLDDTDVPAGALAVGIPARIRAGGARPGMGATGSRFYVETSRRYREELRRIG
jgi:serine acetyltransferase